MMRRKYASCGLNSCQNRPTDMSFDAYKAMAQTDMECDVPVK